MPTPKGGAAVESGLVARIGQGLRYMFTGSGDFFGPGTPMQPAAQEAAHGRAFDYQTGFNLNAKPRSGEKTDFGTLRALADAFDLVRLAIETRKDQMGKLRWKIQKRDGSQDATSDRIETLLRHPDGEHDFGDWFQMLLEDVLVIDAPTVYIHPTRGGQPYAFEQVDGATIGRIIDQRGRTPAPPTPGETFDAQVHGAYQQVIKGLPATYYHANEMVYKPRNPRVHKVYGFSPVEQILVIINIALRRQTHQLAFYTAGNIPDMLLAAPKEWTPAQIAEMQKYFDLMLTGDLEARRQIRFVPGEVKPLALRPEASLFDAFDEWIARVVNYCFSLPPTPFVKQQNRATAETAQEAALSEGLAPLMEWAVRYMNLLIAKGFQTKDYEFVWDDEDSLDPLVQAQVDEIYIRNKVRRVSEVRADHDWEPDTELDALQVQPPPAPIAPSNKTGTPIENQNTTQQPGQAEKLLKARSQRRRPY